MGVTISTAPEAPDDPQVAVEATAHARLQAAEMLGVEVEVFDKVHDIMTAELGGRVPHKTYGRGLMCAVFSISDALAASKDDTCFYARIQKSANIYRELEAFIKNDPAKFRAYCDTKMCERLNVTAKELKRYKSVAKGDNFDWAASENLEIETVCFLIDFWEETHPEDGPINVLLVETFHEPGRAEGYAPLVRCAFRLRERDNAKKHIALRSVDCGNATFGGGHYEVYLDPIEMAQHDEEESHDGLSRPLDPFLEATDPRIGGTVPHTHHCDPYEFPCSKAMHRLEFHDHGAEWFKTEPGATSDSAGDDNKPDADGDDGKDNAAAEAEDDLNNANVFDELNPANVSLDGTAAADSGTSSDFGKFFLFNGVKLPAHEPVEAAPEYHEAQNESHKKAKLVKLLAPKRTDGIQFYGVRDWPVSIAYLRIDRMKADNYLPPGKTLDSPYSGASVSPGQVRLFGSFVKLSAAPGIKLGFQLHRGDKIGKTNRFEHEHNGSVSFYFNPVYDHTKRKLVRGIKKDSFKATWHSVDAKRGRPSGQSSLKHHYIELSFIADSAVAENLVPHGYPPLELHEKQTLTVLKEICDNPGTRVTIRLYPFEAEVIAQEKKGGEFALQQALSEFPGHGGAMHRAPSAALTIGRNFFAYKRGTSERVGVQFNQFKSRHEIVKTATPFVSYPAVHRFIDNSHGEIALGYGHALEHEEEKAHLLAIAKDSHVCTVHSVADFLVVGVRLSRMPDSGLGANYYSLPPNTKLKLCIFGSQAKHHGIEGDGITTEMDLDLSPPASLHVLVTGKNAAKLRVFAQEGLRHQNPRRYLVKIVPELNTTTVTAQIDAVRKAYDVTATEGTKGALLPLLLYNGLVEKATDPWAGCRDQKRAQAAYQELLVKEAWTPTQAKVIRFSKQTKLGVGLVTGPGGSGKTLLMCHKGHAAVMAGDKVAYVSDRNSVLDNICENYVRHYPDDEPPLRAYARQLQASSLAKGGDRAAEAAEQFSGEALALWHLIAQKLQARSDKTFALMEYSVEGHIMRHLAKKTVHRHQFKKGSGPDPAWPEAADVFAYLRDSVQRIEEHRDARDNNRPAPAKKPLGRGEGWKADDKNNTAKSSAEAAKKAADSSNPSTPEDNTAKSTAEPAEKAADSASPPTPDALFSEDESRLLNQAFEACREYVISNAKVLICTAVNCGGDEIRKNFASGIHDRVWMEVDEATTIHEASMLIPLSKCYSTWGRKIVSVWMYGDPKQLGAVVLGSEGLNNSPAFNEFGPQIRLSLFMRLAGCGFPLIELPEQARMHPVLWEPAMRIFYDKPIAFMGDVDKFQPPVDFEGMLRELLSLDKEAALSETQLRLAYFEITGPQTRRSIDTGSRANMASFLATIKLIEGPLHRVYQKDMNSSVAIITPYQRQRQMYSLAFNRLRLAGWTDEELPLLATIDSAVGRERDHVILDCVISSQTHRGLGFMRDDRRLCVGVTRGRKIFWIVGSDFAEPVFKQTGREDDANDQPGDSNSTGQDTASPPTENAPNDDNEKGGQKKKRHPRYDQLGEEMAEHAIVEYRNHCAQQDVLYQWPVPTIKETDWPRDLWLKKVEQAFEKLKLKSTVKYGPSGSPQLTDHQLKLLDIEIAKVTGEYQPPTTGGFDNAKKTAGANDAPAFVPDTGSFVPDTGSFVPDTGSFVPDTGSFVPDTGSFVPDTGSGGAAFADNWSNKGDDASMPEPVTDPAPDQEGYADDYENEAQDEVRADQAEMGEQSDDDEGEDAEGEDVEGGDGGCVDEVEGAVEEDRGEGISGNGDGDDHGDADGAGGEEEHGGSNGLDEHHDEGDEDESGDEDFEDALAELPLSDTELPPSDKGIFW